MKVFNGKKLIFFLFLISLIICEKNQRKRKPVFKCSPDTKKPIPIPAQNILPIDKKSLKNKRTLDSDGFKEFNIFLDLENFNYEAAQYNINENTKQIFINGMNKAVQTIKSLLRVKPPNNCYFTDDQILNLNISHWDTSKIGPNIGMVDAGVDLYIFVRFENTMDEDTLASAGARFLDNENSQPLIGVANINPNVNYNIGNSLQYFQGTILHEFIHILGFSNHFFQNNYHNIIEKEDIYGKQRAYINSPKVLEVAKKYYNCDSIEGIELEESGGSGTVGSHWEERILLGDIMNGVVYPEEQVISEFTLALLEDSGYYKPNYYTGGLMQYGKNKGCEFLNSKCINNNKVIFKNEFFNNIFNHYLDPGCSSGRQSRAYHSLYNYEDYGGIPEEYQYFSDNNLGGRGSADYCPVSEENYYEARDIYFVGHCSNKGSGQYGKNILYDNNQRFTSEQIKDKTGEILSDNSFCVLSSLISTSVNNYQFYSSKVRAVCYQMHCSDQSLTIQINNDFIVCPRQGGKINAINFNGYLLCPDYYLICSGTVLCNDMFDCVEKKSSLKEDIVYNYEIKTSQDIEEAEKESFSENNYELSENGKCPKFCFQCDDSGKCKKCRSGYGIIELTENEITTRNCKLLSELTDGYYNNEGIYYKCMNNCKECNNNYECIACDSGYIYENNKCLLEIQNCLTYDDDGKCTKCERRYVTSENGDQCQRGDENCEDYDSSNNKCSSCKENYVLSNDQEICYKEIQQCEDYNEDETCDKCIDDYALIENDKTICKSKNELNEYYTKDGIIYWKCDGEETNDIKRIINCNECQFTNNELECNKCGNDYVLIDGDNKNCISKTNYNNNEYYYIDEYHIKKCSNEITDCLECEKDENNGNQIICTKCNNNFRVSDNDHKCYIKIEKCQNYDSNEECDQCENNYAFEEDDNSKCINIILFKELYFTNNNKNYYKCGNDQKGGIENCEKCQYDDNQQLICNQCKSEYILKDGINNKCFLKSEYVSNQEYYFLDDYHVKKCSEEITDCIKCEKNGDKINCIECKDNYSFIKDENINCKKTEDIPENEYYLDNNIYYSCLLYNSAQNCKKCTSETNCELCKEGYTFISTEKDICKNIEDLGEQYVIDEIDQTIYRKCSDIIDYCNTCKSKEECLTCINNYGVYNDKKTCVKIDEQDYYKNSNDNLYYLCNTGIENCKKCSAVNKCNKCNDDYVRINNDNSICHPISDINNDEYYIDPKDNNMYLECTFFVKNCLTCKYPNGCKTCKEGFIFLNDDTKTCHEKSKTDLKTYFTNDNMTYYDCNDYKYKNDIQCFSIIPKQKINLEFVQTQLIKKKLFCFMITHSPLPKDFSIKLKINVYSSKNLRILENSGEREIVLTTTDDSNGSKNTLVSFSSSEEYNTDENVQIKEIAFNNDNSVTKTVTDNNVCTLKFNSTSDLLDTGKVASMIQAKKIPDCSSYQQLEIVSLNMNNAKGCEFYLNSEKEISFANDNLDLELVESENNGSTIIAECDTKNDNVKKIKCNINDETNGDYSFKDRIISESDKFITISSENENFNISCAKKAVNKKLLIIILVCVGVAIIIIVIIVAIVCSRTKKPAVNNKNDLNKKIKSDIYRKNTKNKKEFVDNEGKMETIGKFETRNENENEETGQVLNVKNNKRRNSRRKSTKKSKKDKKNKD